MPLSFFLLFDHLSYGRHFFPLLVPQRCQAIPQFSRELSKHPAFYIAIFQYIGYVMGNHLQHLQMASVFPYIVPEFFFAADILRPFQPWRLWIPLIRFQIIAVGLGRKKICKQTMPQLMGEQAADDFIAFLPFPVPGDPFITGVDCHHKVIRLRRRPDFGLPK